MYCATNQGLLWWIDTTASPLLGGSTSAEIPLSYFTFQTYALPDGEGVFSEGTFVDMDTPFSQHWQMAYVAAPSEYCDTDVRIGMVVVIDVPWGQQADTYASEVMLSMTAY